MIGLRVSMAWVGGVLAVLCIAAHVASAMLMYSTTLGWDPSYLLLLGYPVVGAIIVSHQPRNTIGWILVISGTSVSLGLLCSSIVYATLVPEPEPWQQVIAWLTNVTFVGGLEGQLIAMAFLFPTGSMLSRGWKMAGIATGLVFGVSFIVTSFRPGPIGLFFAESPELTNPFGIAAIETVATRLELLIVPGGLSVIVVSLGAVVERVRRSRGIERLQLQWLALALSLVGIATVFSVMSAELLPSWVALVADLIFYLSATLGISVAIGISILRYRLYDIERLVNRSLVYLMLTVSLAVVYLGLVLTLGSLLRSLVGESSGIVTAVSTLAAAALFNPLRTSIQRVVDRRFYRRKHDAARLIEGFSAQLRDEVDLAALSADLQSVVVETMQPAHVSLWLRPRR